MVSTIRDWARSLGATAMVSILVLMAGDFAAAAEPEAARENAAAANTAAELEEVLIEGRRVDERMTTTALDAARFGSQVQLISSAEIDTGGFTNFAELANGLIRGANVGYSPDEGEFTIRIDGGSDRDTLLLLDGVPTFDRGTPLEDIWGATSIDPRMIKSVEILRGGQSLYYGGNGGLGVVSVLYKEPSAEQRGEFGVYYGAFKTREVYGNMSFPLSEEGNQSILFYGRAYNTDSNELFEKNAYNDVVLELGGRHPFPYVYQSVGAKYLWNIDETTSLRAAVDYASTDFRDAFPNDHIYNPNYVRFPRLHAEFATVVSDRLNFEAEAFYQAPVLWNSEVDAQVCRIPQSVINPATRRPFTLASEFEAYARANNIPAGCVTNPETDTKADRTSRTGFYVDSQGRLYGTLQNPFPVGAPMGYVIQTVTAFGTGVPNKGFGEGTQFKAGYVEYGANARGKYRFNDNFEFVFGAQTVSSKDNSAPEYGVSDKVIQTNGIYVDLRGNFDFLAGTSISLAARQDFNNLFDDTFIWRGSLRQEFAGGYYLRGSAGTSYNNPRAQELGLFGGTTVNNPTLKTQEVETFALGTGVNGDVLGGTFNIELGYFDTDISNLFGNAAIRDVCPGVDPTRVINPNIITPTEFCAKWQSLGLTPLDNATFNTKAVQQIKGYTFDLSLDIEKWTLDFSFTKQESLEPNPVFGLTAIRANTGQALTSIVPGRAGGEAYRQSGERPEWLASALLTYQPSDRWTIALNPRWQGPEWLYVQNNAARLVDANGERTNPDLNFGDYFVLNASVQYFMGAERQHRLMLRAVNVFDKSYWERGGATDRAVSRAGVRGEITTLNPAYFYTYGFVGKPRSFFLQYEYRF